MSVEHTGQIAQFVAKLSYEDLTPAAVNATKDVILDAVGVALAGSQEEDAQIAAELIREEASRPESTVIGRGFRAAANQAAFANGVAVHALDFDSSFVMMGQPMAGLMPTVLALAESRGSSGPELMTAYVAGYEVTAKLARCMPGNVEESGWHSTATLGTLGCAMAAGKLLGLTSDQLRAALGIAGSMASGLVANFGTMSKPLHAGLAARNGIQAARLAAHGFTGNRSVLEPGAFFHAFAKGESVNLTSLTQCGAPYEVEQGVRYKAYPCGGLTHSAIDAMLALRSEHTLTPDQITAIHVDVTRHTANRIVFQTPETGIQGKFCMPYIMARAVIDGRLVPDTFTDAAVRDPAALALATRVTMTHDPSLENAPPGSRPAVVRVTLANGQQVERRVNVARGGTHAPLRPGELHEKFLGCARRVLGDEDAHRLLTQLERLDDLSTLASLTKDL